MINLILYVLLFLFVLFILITIKMVDFVLYVFIFLFVFLFFYQSKRLKEFNQRKQNEREEYEKNQVAQKEKFDKDNQFKRDKLKKDQSGKVEELKKDIDKRTEALKKNMDNDNKSFENDFKIQENRVKQYIASGRKIGWFQASLFWLFLIIFYNTYVVNWNFLEQKYSLTVHAKPSNSTIKIMNIKPKYQQGIWLKPGKYTIQVEHQGYLTQMKRVTITNRNVSIKITLKKK